MMGDAMLAEGFNVRITAALGLPNPYKTEEFGRP